MTQRPNSTINCSTRIATRRLGGSVRTARLLAESGQPKGWKSRAGRPRILVSPVDTLLRIRRTDKARGLLIVCEDDERSALAALAGNAVPAMHTDFACDGFDALIRIGAEAPAVVLTHLGLAGMDAIRMLHALAARLPPQALNDLQELLIDRRYIRADPDKGLMVVLEVGRKWWEAKTAYIPTDRKQRPDLKLLDRRRGGKLIWKRK